MNTIHNKIRQTVQGLLIVSLLLGVGFISSCKDDNSSNNSSPMIINSVHLQDATDSVLDRTIQYARLGYLIRLEGSGFEGMKKVYINGVSSYFNPTLLSDGSLIVKVPSDAPTTTADDAVRNKITLVKDGAEYTYDFIIRGAAPTVKSISHTLAQAGETITLYGSQLYEISSITFPGNIAVTSNIISDNDKGTYCTVTVPLGITQSGALLVEGANGSAYSPAYFNFKQGIVNNFDNIDNHSWGGGDLSDNVNASLPAASPKSQGNYRCLNKGYVLGTPTSFPAGAPKQSFSFEKSSVWASLIPNSVISHNLPSDSVALQIDVYIANPWDAGSMRIVLLDEKGADYEYEYAPWIDDPDKVFTAPAWYTISIPLNKFPGLTGKTFQALFDIEATTTYHQYGVFMDNIDLDGAPAVKATDVAIFFDNYRFVPTSTPKYTEF